MGTEDPPTPCDSDQCELAMLEALTKRKGEIEEVAQADCGSQVFDEKNMRGLVDEAMRIDPEAVERIADTGAEDAVVAAQVVELINNGGANGPTVEKGAEGAQRSGGEGVQTRVESGRDPASQEGEQETAGTQREVPALEITTEGVDLGCIQADKQMEQIALIGSIISTIQALTRLNCKRLGTPTMERR